MRLLKISDVTEFDLACQWYDEYREIYPKVDTAERENHFARWILENKKAGTTEPFLLTETI